MRKWAALLCLLLAAPAFAADHTVTSGDVIIDCDTFGGGVNAGDTLTMDDGNRGPVRFQDCIGTSGNHIVIRNDTTGAGPTVVQKTSSGTGGFSFECKNCEFLTIDGTGKWVGAPAGTCGYFNQEFGRTQCGIVVEQVSIQRPSVYMMFRGSSSDYTVKGTEIDGDAGTTGGSGLGHHLRDGNYTLTDHPGEWRENVLYEKNYVHDTNSSAFYIGSNIGNDELFLRNIEIKEFLVEDIGRRGPTIKMSTEGTNTIHHGYAKNLGLNGDISGFGHGLMFYEGGGIFYNNYVENAGEVGIQCYHSKLEATMAATQPCEAYNNVVINAGATGPLAGQGINCGIRVLSPPRADFDCDIYNNTVIDSESHGLSINSGVGVVAVVQDNISCDSGGNDVNANGGDTTTSNQTGTCSSQGFVNLVGLDLHLTAGANAVGAGGIYFAPPTDDLDEVSRPQGAAIDDGGYEWDEGGGGPPAPGDDITTPKPSPHVIDNLETWYPDYLWVLNEGATATTEDDGSATDCDMSITGATWGADAIGNYLSFDGDADFAENNACTGFTGTQTMFVIARFTAPDTFDTLAGMYDASDADQQLDIQLSGPINSYNQAAATTSGATFSAINNGSTSTGDGLWNMLAIRASETSLDVSVNGAPWDTSSPTLTGLLTGIDRVAIGGRRPLVGSNYATADILAFWIYNNTSLTDANIATVYNDGDPWPIIGVDPSSGPPPVAQRGQFNSSPLGVRN